MKEISKTMKKTRRVEDLSPEELRAVKAELDNEIADVIRQLMQEPGYYGVGWRGTTTDLADLVHHVWLTDTFFDSCGRQLTYRAMIDHVCKVLNRPRIANPYRLVERAGARKRVYAIPVMERYLKLKVENRLKNPMTLDMKRDR